MTMKKKKTMKNLLLFKEVWFANVLLFRIYNARELIVFSFTFFADL